MKTITEKSITGNHFGNRCWKIRNRKQFKKLSLENPQLETTLETVVRKSVIENYAGNHHQKPRLNTSPKKIHYWKPCWNPSSKSVLEIVIGKHTENQKSENVFGICRALIKLPMERNELMEFINKSK